jgi:hypothetical protein
LPANIGLTFGDDGEKIEGNGTDLTIASSNDLHLTATTDINVPANVGLTFGDDGEKIEGNGTDLTIAASNLLNLTATTDVVIPVDVGLIFGDGGEKIESNNTNFTITSGGDIVLAPSGGDVLPDGDNTRNLGSATVRWANIYTGDLHLKNSRGDWTILEEEDYLCVINNKTNKKYKMLLQELDEGEGE